MYWKNIAIVDFVVDHHHDLEWCLWSLAAIIVHVHNQLHCLPMVSFLFFRYPNFRLFNPLLKSTDNDDDNHQRYSDDEPLVVNSWTEQQFSSSHTNRNTQSMFFWEIIDYYNFFDTIFFIKIFTRKQLFLCYIYKMILCLFVSFFTKKWWNKWWPKPLLYGKYLNMFFLMMILMKNDHYFWLILNFVDDFG